MKKITRNIATLMLLTVATTAATAQVVEQKVGDNSLIINPNAVLDIESTNRGLLLPRLALTATDAFAPLTAHVEGMTVYNTATAGTGATAVTPGYYYNDGSKWVRIATGNDAKTEPWREQDTGAEADDNQQDIYQQGKVAVGFTDADAVSGKQLEVKGDVKTEFVDTDDYIYGFQTNMTNGSQKENLMYVADNEDFSLANHYSFLGVNKKNVAFMNLDKTGSQEKFAAVLASNLDNGGLVSMATETSDGKYANIGAITWSDDVQGGIETRQTVGTDHIEMDLFVRPKSGISFNHQGSTGYGSYTFPKNSPTEGQVLSASATSNTYGGRQLEWKTPASALTEPWQVQGATNEATANTENIFQLGSVAIGANIIPSITTGSGTVNPTLHVAGDVSTTGKFYTTSSVYADYVFEKYFDCKSEINNKYEFKSLDYIKEFVEKNKHLPGVTKIEDLLKGENGYMFDMTELSIQQLEKIEELFLHVIEQNEQIIELEKQVEDNNNRLDALEKLLLDNSK